MSRAYPALGSRPARLAVTLALAVASLPLLSACGGSGNATHDACMGAASERAGVISGDGAATFNGDYDLMNLCDSLVERFEGDEGRVLHAVECIGDRVDGINDPDSLIYFEGDVSASEMMNDPLSVGSCV